MSKNISFFSKVKSHPTVRAGSTYALVAFIAVQVTSLVSGPLGFSPSLIQSAIWLSIVGFPIVVLLSFIISSHFSTIKLLALTFGILISIYLGGSFYWIQFVKNPELEKAAGADEYAKTWMIAREINRIFPFLPQIQDALDYVMRKKTVIAIAHRLSTIVKMDRIILLHEGKIAEQGTHNDLLAFGGLYCKYWERQSGGFIGIDRIAV